MEWNELSTNVVDVAVFGSGYWGKNLVRVFHGLKRLRCVCDLREEPLREVEREYGVQTTQDVQAVLRDERIRAVVIAAPAVEHFDLAKRALLANKDVFVEKPLALRSQDGSELVELAARQERILMVGHILEYHPAVETIKRLITEGELGRIQYIYSSRLNLGKLRIEVAYRREYSLEFCTPRHIRHSFPSGRNSYEGLRSRRQLSQPYYCGYNDEHTWTLPVGSRRTFS